MPRISRRSFLEISAAVGGGLLVGFALPPRRAWSQSRRFAPNAFIRIDPDGRVTLIMHKVEMGQGTYTAMPMLLAEELEVDLSQVRLEHAPPVKRLDAPAKVDGTAPFGIDVKLPGMKVATVAACPVLGGKVAAVDDTRAKTITGVHQVVRLDDAVAVVADHMWAAKQGLAALDIQWDEGPNHNLSTADIVRRLELAAQEGGALSRKQGNAAKAILDAPPTVTAVHHL